MYLIRTKSIGISIKMPWPSPERISDDRLKELIPILQGPRTEERDAARAEVISGFYRLAMSIVSKYAAHYPSRVDDYLSEAMWAVVNGVDKAIENRNFENLSSYIYTKVHSACADLVRTFPVITIPQETMRRYVTDGISIEYTVLDDLTTVQEDAIVNDTERTLNSLAKTVKEQVFLQLAKQGHNDTDIHRKTGWSRVTIAKCREELRRRWKELTEKENMKHEKEKRRKSGDSEIAPKA